MFSILLASVLAMAAPGHDHRGHREPVPSLDLETPEQYKGPATAYVLFNDLKDVVKWCGPASNPKWTKMGCMMSNGYLILANPCDEKVWPEVKDHKSYAFYVCHEKAHVNGWRH